ncbi:hypothetical protein N8A98_05095 [Devosia neptuniae]|jgi:hypothetical protein|uniref:Uncharacterized protein n=1 Tax=Devosia neptuniae TaxID=191302 RepID=A0ABY6CHU0_9HYPH|nr:hypothetical protein [Devosia neptuniae]UXN70571.1 hypothetical protein N8A98_05095 [Devosia neptuniae]
MTYSSAKGHDPKGLSDILAADEAAPSLGRQVFNGLTGTLVLLVTGILVLLVVLWKSP